MTNLPAPVQTAAHDRDRDHDHDHDESHHDGLAHDLDVLRTQTLRFAPMQRRNVLRLFGGAAGVLAIAGTQLVSSRSAAAAASVIPEETAGPYPGDGSNGPNVLT
jgi:hypothetical protein